MNKFIKRNHNFIKKNPTYNQNIVYKRQSHKLIPPTIECYLYLSSTNLMLRGETKSHLLYENKISKYESVFSHSTRIISRYELMLLLKSTMLICVFYL